MNTLFLEQNPEEKRRFGVAFILSVAAHLLLLLLVILYMMAGKYFQFSPKPESDSIEMVFVNPNQQQPSYVATSASQKTDQAPEQAAFESDNNTRAASEAPASGLLPLPSQEGAENKALEFENQNYSVGTEPQQSAQASAPSQPQKAQEATPETQQQQQQTPPEAQPENRNEVHPNSIALLEPPVSKTTREKRPVPERPANPASAAARPGYQPQTRVTRIRGGISNRGRSGVDAISTPLGRYKKVLSDAIGSRWYYYVDKQMGLFSIGTVQIQFVVRADGSVHRAQVTTNSSNESFATCSLQSIMDAKIPPIPADVAQSLQGQSLEVDFTFSIISN